MKIKNHFFIKQKKIHKEKYLIFIMINGLRKKFLISKQITEEFVGKISYKNNKVLIANQWLMPRLGFFMCLF